MIPIWLPNVFFIAAGLTTLALIIFILYPKIKRYWIRQTDHSSTLSGSVITNVVLQNSTNKPTSVIGKPKQHNISEVVFDILRKMRYQINESQKLINIPDLQESDRVIIEKLYYRYGDTVEERGAFFVRLTHMMHKVTQPNLEKLLEDNDDWGNLNRKLDIIKNRLGDKDFTGKCLAYIEFAKGMAMDNIYFRYNNERTTSISSEYYLEIIETRIHKLLKKYKKVIIDDMDLLTVNLEDVKRQLVVDGLPQSRWHGNRLGRSWRLPIKNISTYQAEECQGKLIEIASELYGFEKGLSLWPGNEYLNWSTGSASISIAPADTMELEIMNYEGYGSPVNLAYSKGEDFRKLHSLKSFNKPLILIIGVTSKSKTPIYCVCKFHPNRLKKIKGELIEDNDNLELIKVVFEKPDIKLYQKLETDNGDSQS